MGHEELVHLHRIGQLKSEPRNVHKHTLGWPPHQWRVLDAAHQKRNLAEYEGYWDVPESAIDEICNLLPDLISAVEKLKTTP